MSDLQLLSSIHSQIQESLEPVEPTRDAAQRDRHKQSYTRSKTELVISCNNAIRQAEHIETAIATANQDNATIGSATIDLYRQLSTQKIKEVQAKLALSENLARRHTVVSNFTVYEEDNPHYMNSDYKQVMDEVRNLQVQCDRAINPLLIAMSKLAIPKPPTIRMINRGTDDPKSNPILHWIQENFQKTHWSGLSGSMLIADTLEHQTLINVTKMNNLFT